MATKNKPGQDSYYLVVKDNAELVQKVSALSGVSTEVKDVLERKQLRSRYIWLSDQPAKTKDGDIIIEVGRDMIKAQTELAKTVPDMIYDKNTIRKIMPTEAIENDRLMG